MPSNALLASAESTALPNIADWLTLGVSAAGFATGLIMLWVTKRSVDALILQLKTQAYHSLVEAHKSLFLPVVTSRELSQIAFGNARAQLRGKLLASIMINHASLIFSDIHDGVIPDYDIAVFRRDLLDLFELEGVRGRWPEVKGFHKPAFVHFVDETLRD
jgi:hypothetical protein